MCTPKGNAITHALDNEAKRGELVPADEVYRALATLFTLIKQEILASDLTADRQDSLLRHLADFNYLTKERDAPKSNGAHSPPTAKPGTRFKEIERAMVSLSLDRPHDSAEPGNQ